MNIIQAIAVAKTNPFMAFVKLLIKSFKARSFATLR